MTPQGEFRDMSSQGNLQAKLRRASLIASSRERNGYAQDTLWMTSHKEEVRHMLQDSGLDLVGVMEDEVGFEEQLLIENKTATSPTKGWSGGRQKGEVHKPVPLSVIEIRLSAVPRLNLMGTLDPVFTIMSAGSTISSTEFLPSHTYRSEGPIILAVPAFGVVDEMLVTFYERTAMGGKSKIFAFWLHTGFIREKRVLLTKPEIDKANKDKKHKKYPADFTVEILFDDVSLEVERVGDMDENCL